MTSCGVEIPVAILVNRVRPLAYGGKFLRKFLHFPERLLAVHLYRVTVGLYCQGNRYPGTIGRSTDSDHVPGYPGTRVPGYPLLSVLSGDFQCTCRNSYPGTQ
eukprot:544618-Rhodomonas_salina.1